MSVKKIRDMKSIKSDETISNEGLKSIVQQALVKKFVQGNDRPCDQNDFLETKGKLEKFSLELKELVESIENNNMANKSDGKLEISHNYADINTETLSLLLILCGQNNTLQLWNTEATLKNCRTIFLKILNILNCKDPYELFFKNNRINLIKNTLQMVCADLTASTWKQFPASVACYKWFLHMIKQPKLSQYLELIFPPALLLTDDFVKENRIIGVECLNHIIHNITISELQLYGHGEVMYNALIPILRTRETVLIQCMIFPLISLTTKLEFDLGKKNQTKWSKFDSILEIYLESMELEQLIDLRNCYIKNLRILISNMGYNIVRWSKRLLRIFDEYIQTAGKYQDEKIIYHCIQAIEKFIDSTKETTFLHAKNLLCTLQIALYSIISFNGDTPSETLEATVGCIKKLLNSLTDIEKQELKSVFVNNLSGNLKCEKFYITMYEILDGNK